MQEQKRLEDDDKLRKERQQVTSFALLRCIYSSLKQRTNPFDIIPIKGSVGPVLIVVQIKMSDGTSMNEL